MTNSLLPPTASPAERAIEAATARLADLPVPLRELWSPDACPLALLPWLAWAYSVDQWDSRWTEAQKRAVVRNSLFVHRYKGTLGAVERAIGALGYTVRIVEWFDDTPRADAFTFRVDIHIADTGIDEPMYATMERLVNDAKNVRSYLSGLRLVARTDGLLAVAGVPALGEVIDVGVFTGNAVISRGQVLFRAGTLQDINLNTRPE